MFRKEGAMKMHTHTTRFGNKVAAIVATLCASTIAPNAGAVTSPGNWSFDSDEVLCLISTRVPTDENSVYVDASAYLHIYYIHRPPSADPCYADLAQDTITASIFAHSLHTLLDGSNAILHSDSLWNEQAAMQYFSQECDVNRIYTLDHRVTGILLDALNSHEEIRIDFVFDKLGPMTGPVRTTGFDTAYAQFMECVESTSDPRYASD